MRKTLIRVKSILRSSNFLIFSRPSLPTAFIIDASDTVASLSDQVASVRGYFNIKSASPRSAFLSARFPRHSLIPRFYERYIDEKRPVLASSVCWIYARLLFNKTTFPRDSPPTAYRDESDLAKMRESHVNRCVSVARDINTPCFQRNVGFYWYSCESSSYTSEHLVTLEGCTITSCLCFRTNTFGLLHSGVDSVARNLPRYTLSHGTSGQHSKVQCSRVANFTVSWLR